MFALVGLVASLATVKLSAEQVDINNPREVVINVTTDYTKPYYPKNEMSIYPTMEPSNEMSIYPTMEPSNEMGIGPVMDPVGVGEIGIGPVTEGPDGNIIYW